MTGPAQRAGAGKNSMQRFLARAKATIRDRATASLALFGQRWRLQMDTFEMTALLLTSGMLMSGHKKEPHMRQP